MVWLVRFVSIFIVLVDVDFFFKIIVFVDKKFKYFNVVMIMEWKFIVKIVEFVIEMG